MQAYRKDTIFVAQKCLKSVKSGPDAGSLIITDLLRFLFIETQDSLADCGRRLMIIPGHPVLRIFEQFRTVLLKRFEIFKRIHFA